MISVSCVQFTQVDRYHILTHIQRHNYIANSIQVHCLVPGKNIFITIISKPYGALFETFWYQRIKTVKICGLYFQFHHSVCSFIQQQNWNPSCSNYSVIGTILIWNCSRIIKNLYYRDYFFLIKPTDALIFPNLFLSRNSTCFGQRNCPKHVEFLDVNKFGKITASVGFIKMKFVMMHGHMNVK